MPFYVDLAIIHRIEILYGFCGCDMSVYFYLLKVHFFLNRSAEQVLTLLYLLQSLPQHHHSTDNKSQFR